MPNSATCKLCGEQGKRFAKAHIIPRSLYASALHHPKGPARILSDFFGGFSKRTPTGIYDGEIVCIDCERRFTLWDDYVNRLLLKTKPNRIWENSGERLAYVYSDVNYPLLKLFFISLLWRAHTTQHQFFASVRLGGKLERQAREMILSSNPGTAHQFSVVVARFDDELANGFLNPFHERYDGVGVYRFFFSQHVVYIKVTTKPFGPELRQLILSPNRELFIVARDYRESSEFRTMLDMVRRLPH